MSDPEPCGGLVHRRSAAGRAFTEPCGKPSVGFAYLDIFGLTLAESYRCRRHLNRLVRLGHPVYEVNE